MHGCSSEIVMILWHIECLLNITCLDQCQVYACIGYQSRATNGLKAHLDTRTQCRCSQMQSHAWRTSSGVRMPTSVTAMPFGRTASLMASVPISTPCEAAFSRACTAASSTGFGAGCQSKAPCMSACNIKITYVWRHCLLHPQVIRVLGQVQCCLLGILPWLTTRSSILRSQTHSRVPGQGLLSMFRLPLCCGGARRV